MIGEISVVIPTKNRPGMLREAISSVLESPLGDCGLRFERAAIIVVDDATADDTKAVVKEFGVQYVPVSEGIPSKVRNAGLALVETEFVSFLDDDDVWEPGNMLPQLRALRASPAMGFAFTQSELVGDALDPWDVFLPETPPFSCSTLEELVLADVQLGCVLFRTSVLRDVGGFSSDLRYCEDWDLYLRLGMRSRFGHVEGKGSLFRQRVDDPANGEMRWRSFRDRERAWTRLRRDGLNLPWRVKLERARRHRGFSSAHLCLSARLAVERGDRAAARRYLAWAIRVSPPHAVTRGSDFWNTLFRATGPVLS